jgi:hypothetical protein
MIICPYLGKNIWTSMNNSSNISFSSFLNKYIKNILEENIVKYPSFYLEWYRHWETSTGVVWKKRAVKKINEIHI